MGERDPDPDIEGRTTVPIRIRAVTAPSTVGEGAELGEFRLLSELGTGGMATVFEAISLEAVPSTPRVALKVLHEHLARETVHVENFLDEGRLGLKLRHPAICRVLDLGKVGGRPYVVMELLQGTSLDRLYALLQRRPHLAEDSTWTHAIVSIIADLADGLHAAHALTDERGRSLEVIHRDVSPENLYVLDDGSVRLADFGVARHAARLHGTSPGMVKGKLAYLAPEAFQERPLDRRADVWSLGVVLWELLTGRGLFRRGGDAEVMGAVLQRRVAAPSSLRAGCDAELDAIVLATLERVPERRLGGADTLRDRLRGWLARREAHVEPPARARWLADLGAALAELPRRISSVQSVVTPVPVTPSSEAPTVADEVAAPAPAHPRSEGSDDTPFVHRRLRPVAALVLATLAVALIVGALFAWHALT